MNGKDGAERPLCSVRIRAQNEPLFFVQLLFKEVNLTLIKLSVGKRDLDRPQKFGPNWIISR
jgi:hypothetical protein